MDLWSWVTSYEGLERLAMQMEIPKLKAQIKELDREIANMECGLEKAWGVRRRAKARLAKSTKFRSVKR